VRARRGDIDEDGFVLAESPEGAFPRFVRRKKLWPKGAGAHFQRFPGGHTWWVWPTRAVGGGTSLGDMWVARIEEEE